MYCSNCGKTVEGVSFCSHCGADQRNEAVITEERTDDATTPETRGGRRRLFVIGGAVAAIAVAGTGIAVLAGGGSGSDTVTVTGSFVSTKGADSAGGKSDGEQCWMQNSAWSGFGAGTGVYVKDESGTVLGADRLGEGVVVDEDCVWTFEISGVPTDATMFEFSDDFHTNGLFKTQSEMELLGWNLDLEP